MENEKKEIKEFNKKIEKYESMYQKASEEGKDEYANNIANMISYQKAEFRNRNRKVPGGVYFY